MALILADRVKQESTTTGTGAFSFSGGVDGFQAFSAVCSTNDTLYYVIQDKIGTNFEIGHGTFNGSGQLERTNILQSSNSDNVVDFGAGTKEVFITYPADKAVFQNYDGSITIPSTIDGRDLQTDGTKLDGIEASADVTDTANVTSAGALMLSGGTMTGDTLHADNVKAKFGTGNDLQIYHDSSNSYITDTGTGGLYLQANADFLVQSQGSNENMIYGASNAFVKLYHNGTERLATTASGIDVSGGVQIDDGGSLGFGGTNYKIEGSSSANHRIAFHTDGSERARFDSSGNLLVGKTSSNIATDGVELGIRVESTTDGSYPLRLNRRNSDGEVINLRKDNTTVGRISTTSTGIALGTPKNNGSGLHLISDAILPSTSTGGTADGSKDLGSSSSRFQDIYLSGTANVNAIDIKDGSSIHGTITTSSSSLTFNARNTGNMLFQSGGSEKMRMLSDGKLGIGTTSPDREIDIESSSTVGLRATNTSGSQFDLQVAGNTSMGTLDSTSLLLATNNTERMRIDSSGNVGIGTSSIDVITQAGGSGYRVLQLENNEGGQINLDHTDAGTGSTLGMINFNRAGETVAHIGGVTDGATDNGQINFRTQPTGGALTERMRITSAGKVGIGTTSPSELLEVASSSDPAIKLNGGASGNPLIDFSQNGGQRAYIQYLDSGDLWTFQSDGSTRFLTGGSSEKMRIDNTGRLGLGTSSPTVKFQVVGESGDWSGDFKNYTSGAYGLRVDLSGASGTGYALACYTHTGTGLFLKSNGLLGIGTTQPARTFHVNSSNSSVASFEGHQGEGLVISSATNGQIDIIGYDDGASSYNKLVIRANGSGNNIEVNTDGSVTMPLQPAFSVQGQDQFNVGNGDTITFATEIFDQNADFASNTFTAPIAGRYQFNVGVSFVNPDDTANYQRVLLVTSNRNYSIGIKTIPESSGGTNNYWSAENSVLVDMDASDTAYVTWSQSAGSNESDVFDSSRFSGFLVC